MLYVTDLGKIVLASECVALHCGKPVVYTNGYSIKRPVFSTTSSIASTSTTTTVKQSSKVIFACKEHEQKEQITDAINESSLSPQVVTNYLKISTDNSSEMSDVYFTAHITFDATLQQPTFTVTRSDQPEVKKYVCSHNPNKAWKAALCDVLHDFPDRVHQMTFAVEEKGVFTRGINCLGLNLSDVSRALQDLPLYSDLITLWEANKSKNVNSQVSVAEMEQQYASSNTSNNLNTSTNNSDNAYILVNTQTSTMSVNSTNTPSLHKRGRTEETSESAKQRNVTEGASRRRGSKSETKTIKTTTTVATSTSKCSNTLVEGNNTNTSMQHRPSLSLTCAVCGLTNTPFCAVTGAAHASIYFSTSSSDATNNSNDKLVCTKCGLNSVFCPVTGIPHTMESNGDNINQSTGNDDDNGALSAEGQRQGRKRGEVRLPKNTTRAVRRNPRLVKSRTHSGDVVAEIKDELLQPRQRKSCKIRINKETLTSTNTSNTANASLETTEMYIKDDDNDSSDNATHNVEEQEQEEEDLPLCDINISWNNKDERSDDIANNKKSRKRSRPVSVKSTQERTPRAPSRTSMQSVHTSQNKPNNRTRSKSRQSKTPSRSLPLSQQMDNKDINTNVGNSNNNTTVTYDAVNVNRSQDKVIDTFSVAQDVMAVSANSTISAITEKSKHQNALEADLENVAELEEMPLADLMLQEVYVYPPLKSPLPQSEQTKAATILQQRWRAELGSVLLPPQHETLLLPMLTTRKNANTNQRITISGSTNTFANIANTVVQPAKRGRRKMKMEENNTDNTNVNNINETVNGEIKDEITNNDADSKPNENNSCVDNVHKGEVDTEIKVTHDANDKADGDTSEAATMPSSPLQDVSSPTSTNTDNASNAATLMYPLQINNTATSVAVRRYLNFLWQYTSERTKQEALKTMTTATVKDDSESATVPRKARRNSKNKSENKQMTEELNKVKPEVVADVTDFIDDVIKNEIIKTEAREEFIEPVAILDDHAMTVTPDAAEVTESTL